MRIAILTETGKTYSPKRLQAAAIARGHDCEIIRFPKCYVDIERDNPQVRYEGRNLNDFDVVITRITPSLTAYGAAIARQFEMMGVYTLNRSIALVRSRDKLRSLQLLSKAGVGIPKTVFSKSTASVDDLIEQIGTPMIIKVARGSQGNGVVLAETRKAAKSVVQAFYVEGVSILLQEFIEEAGGADIRAFIVGNQVVASYKRQSLTDDFRSNVHQGGTGTPVKLTPEEKKTALKAAKAMGLQICGVDLIQSERGPLVLEVNAAPGLEGIEKVTGKDIATKIIEYIEQNAKGKRRKDRVGA
jgi:ribosomal protein S6--L-glutamate ligase